MKSNKKIKKEIKITDKSKILEMCEENIGNRNKHNTKSSFHCPQKISMNLQSLFITEIKK